ncbi:MAG: hypothetical protein QM692_15975 [Thermomicrobiales bacterium]
MTAQPTPGGVVNATPEAGPVHAGEPAATPGAGQVRLTPEAGPLAEPAGETLTPPTWQEHMKGPVLGLDDQPAAAAQAAQGASISDAAAAASQAGTFTGGERTPEDDAELKKWPPHIGKPVSDVNDAWRYAAPIVSQAEKLAIGALGLTGQGLTKLAGFLEQRRADRASNGDERQS